MKYMLLMYADPIATRDMSTTDRTTVAEKHKALVAAPHELVEGAGLDYPWTTVTHRWNRGAASAVDGPFLDALEQLSAYYVVDCTSRERASELAGGLLDFHVTTVEVRRIHT